MDSQYIEDYMPDAFDGIPASTKGTYDRDRLLAKFDKAQVESFVGPGRKPLSYFPHPLIRRRLIDYGGGVEFRKNPAYILNGAIVIDATMVINGEAHDETGTEPVPNSPDGMANAVKMAVSDAWKRCAMSFGIGLELWEGEEEEWKSQSPVSHAQPQRPPGSYNNGGGNGYSQPRQPGQSMSNDPDGITDRQVNFAKSLLQERGYVADGGHTDLSPADNIARQMFRKDFLDLNKREATQIIDRIKFLQPNGVQI